MRSKVAVLLCAFVIAACQKKQEPVAAGQPARKPLNIPTDASGKRASVIDPVGTAVIETMLVGAQLRADGTVSNEQTVFTVGEPIYLTLRLRDSPVGLRTGAVWYGQGEQKIASEHKEMNGSKVATFVLRQKLAPGKYRVRGYWGGNIAGEQTFEVESKTKPSK
ncbi:MAG: hypothetical protein QOC81_1837 [Thermoanaerobaculia bacterium]|jgi:hypothetical protein|nr:hypothetical protein [Thermoanaerobaculia bacterium]